MYIVQNVQGRYFALFICFSSWYFDLTLKVQITMQVIHFVVCRDVLGVSSANSVGPDQEQSDLGQHCLPLYSNKSMVLANKCSRRQKQTTLRDAALICFLLCDAFFQKL